jgi:hypothetical protein
MNTEDQTPGKWTLKGELDPSSISRRQALLSTFFDNAKSKGSLIAKLRQTNLNYAIVIFAALFTFSFKFTKGWYSVTVSAALCLIMSIFSILDRKFHKYIHGWRDTEKHLMDKITTLLNKPQDDIVFRRYVKEAEQSAEAWGWQPIITYLLIAVSGIHFFYCLMTSINR